MAMPALIGLSHVFLACILLGLPLLSLHSARQLRALSPSPEVRRAIWMSSGVSLGALLLLSVVVGRQIGYPFLATPRITATAVLATVVAFGACLALRAISERIRSEQERRSMVVRLLVPLSRGEWIAWTGLVILAGVAEEVAYRGVGMSILTHWLDDPMPAAMVSSAGFAAAHALQGWKSGVVIFGIALVMHGLVALTGTLLFAVIVHIVYDLVAAYFIARDASVEHGVV